MVCSLNLKNDNWVVSVILFYMNYVVLLKWQDKLGKETNLETLFCMFYLIDVVVMFIGFGLERKLTSVR